LTLGTLGLGSALSLHYELKGHRGLAVAVVAAGAVVSQRSRGSSWGRE
jgi:hypothetical protein